MSMEYIRKNYSVPAKRGCRIEFLGKGPVPVGGVITGSRGARLRIRLDGEKVSRNYHPTWALRYLPKQPNGEV